MRISGNRFIQPGRRARLFAIALVIAWSVTACGPSGEDAKAAAQASAAEEKMAVAMEMVRTWNDRDWEKMYGMFTEDGVLHSVMMDPIVGRDAIRARLEPLAAGIDQIELKISNMGVVGDVVMLERVDDFVFNGQPGQVPVVGVMEIEDGKVSAWREYYDYATLEHALMPPADQMAQAIAAQIETLTEKLETDWNSGDMDAYLAAYWNDANMSLMFGDGGLRGWQAVKDLFSSSWTTEEAMGDFEVDEMEVRMIRPDIAIASGSFEHRFPAETIVGAFTHVWQHTEGGEWLIVHEHTSRANPPSD